MALCIPGGRPWRAQSSASTRLVTLHMSIAVSKDVGAQRALTGRRVLSRVQSAELSGAENLLQLREPSILMQAQLACKSPVLASLMRQW